MRFGSSLATRLTLAIVALVLLTAVSVGYRSYRNLVELVVPRTLARLDANTRGLASDLAAVMLAARADLKGFRHIIGLEEVIELKRDPSTAAAGGQNAQQWRVRMARRLAAELEAKPDLSSYRVIGVADGGREIVRAERREDGTIRIVADEDLERTDDSDLFRQGIAAPNDGIITSPVEFDGSKRATIRVSTPLFANDGTRFGFIVVDVDLQGPFARLADTSNRDAMIYVVNDRGDYLLRPEASRDGALETGERSRIQDDLPALATALPKGEQSPTLTTDRRGHRYGVAYAPVRLVDNTPLSVVELVPEPKILGLALTVWKNSTVVGGGIAVVVAIVLAIVLARTMTRPLSQLTRSVAAFSEDTPLKVPVTAGGEIGVLARAFEKMTEDVGAKNAALRHEKDVFDSIMTTMADCVVLIDINGNVVYHNRANRDLLAALQMTAAEWRELYDLYSADDRTQLSRDQWPSARALRGETIDNYEIVCRRRDSSKTIHLAGSARPLRDASGTQTGAVVVFRDVTEIRATERKLRQSQKLEAIGQLTGGVAHDFNNMLTVITGTAEVLIEDLEADRPDLAALAKMIAQAADRGADLTGHLLAFARRQPLQPANVDVNAMVLSTTRMLLPTLGEHIEIQSMLEDDVAPAHIDPSQLSAALLNLAVNARDAMPQGGKLTIETGNLVLDESYAQHNADVRPGAYVMIAVSDTGIGIPASLRDTVFEPFFTTKDVGKGTGLGLSMVYGFVKQSNGHIKIYSEEGHGTTIKLYLPRADGAAIAASVTGPIEGGNETILVVEDDALLRNFVVTQLQSLGYRTLAAANGVDALAMVDGGASFDLLFTDVIMPGGINGRQLADTIAIRRRLKVLYTSGYTENAIVHHGRLDAGVLLLPKPYRKSELAQMVRVALNSAVVNATDPIDSKLRAAG